MLKMGLVSKRHHRKIGILHFLSVPIEDWSDHRHLVIFLQKKMNFYFSKSLFFRIACPKDHTRAVCQSSAPWALLTAHTDTTACSRRCKKPAQHQAVPRNASQHFHFYTDIKELKARNCAALDSEQNGSKTDLLKREYVFCLSYLEQNSPFLLIVLRYTTQFISELKVQLFTEITQRKIPYEVQAWLKSFFALVMNLKKSTLIPFFSGIWGDDQKVSLQLKCEFYKRQMLMLGWQKIN